ANGYPFGVIAGKKEYMEYFVHPDKDRRVLIAGTFNAHPFTTAAAIATLRKLADPKYAVYDHVENLGVQLEKGLEEALNVLNTPYYIGRQGSAFCVYFMDHQPVDFHDVMLNHDLNLDKKYRLKLIEKGIFNFPMPIKQGSISFAHSTEDIAITIRSEEHTSELQSRENLVCRLLLEKKNTNKYTNYGTINAVTQTTRLNIETGSETYPVNIITSYIYNRSYINMQ